LISAEALPQTALGELTTLPRPYLYLRGPSYKGREGKVRKEEGQGGMEGEGRGG